ncbi:MAG: hypothetical protein AB9882_02665 [Ignavibacteriaceae bacterium]
MTFNKFDLHYSIGLTLSQLPTKIVEDVFDQVPMIDFRTRLQFSNNLGLTAELNTNILTNLVKIGPFYSHSFNKFSFSAGNDFLAWYGFYNSSDFDISVFGWGYSPYLAAGYDFEDFYVTFRGEINIKAQYTYMRKLQYSKNTPKLTGAAFSVAVEQPLWNTNYVVLGFTGNYTKFFYKSWISFSTFDEYLFYPEFFAGFIF